MKDFVFITGNQYKADYLAKWIGYKVERQTIDLEELQSLDAYAVVEHKVKEAFKQLGRPVLVEDVSFTLRALGRLPGTLIKWFLQELGQQGLLELAHKYEDNSVVVSIIYALYDGNEIKYFGATVEGTVSTELRGESHGWNSLFIPDGYTQTFAEMDDETFHACSHRGQALEKLKAYLKTA